MNYQKLIALLEQAIEIIRSDIEQAPVAAMVAPVQSIIDLVASTEWPEAVPEFLICENSESDKIERAEGILDYLSQDFSNKRVLDFGCGEGHLAVKMAEKAVKSIGYDVTKTGQLDWETGTLTTDFSKVVAEGPYDFIVLYDVLDHCQDPVVVLSQVKQVCHLTTVVSVRCHSWMSRHGGHLYRQLNKAWAHVFLRPEELSALGVNMEFVQKYYFPIDTQSSWFERVGFKIASKNIVRSAVEPFFSENQLLKGRIPKEFDGTFPEWQLGQTFNDYVLTF